MNRLAKEKSPYLLQHQHNPVDWYAWGPEAFEKARRENKLIFLSIGYSTCHWCHVMERESFEKQDVADILNRDFVSIKVDREERPDIDHIYMAAVQALTGSGGWPLSVFLTPDGKPFTGGTYFPPEDRWGRPGFKSVLLRLAQLWKTSSAEILETGERLTQAVEPLSQAASQKVPTENLFQKAFDFCESSFDPVWGGFGGAPKFPRSHDLSFLLRYAKRFNSPKALDMISLTLKRMAQGGIRDHLGGGFARYATDETWLIPHFEKMLYDQAMLARTYLEVYQATRDEFFAETARDIFRYVLRDLHDKEGGFYSAEDADSEGEEGKFYVWRPEEINAVLGPEDGRLFREFYGVSEEGNFEGGASILYEFKPLEGDKEKFSRMRQKLFELREKRVRPHRDDKILTSWNGLMIGALALGHRALGDENYRAAAEKAADFILKRLTAKGRLLRRFREGEAAIPAFQDDYAFLAAGLLDLYESTFEPRWLETAKTLTDDMIRLFWDEKGGGFFYTAADAETMICRTKEYYDGAVPSANSMAAMVLLRLSRMLAVESFEKRAQQVFESNFEALNQHPTGFTQMLMALDFALGPSSEIILRGEWSSPSFQKLWKVLCESFIPRAVFLHCPADKTRGRLEKLAPYLKKFGPAKAEATAYVCKNFACEKPTSDPAVLKRILLEGNANRTG